MFDTIRRYFKRWLVQDTDNEIKALKYQFAMMLEIANQNKTKLKAMEARITLLEAQLKDMEGDL